LGSQREPLEEIARIDFESGCQTEDVQQRDVPLTPLKRAHVRSVELAALGEGFLGETEFSATVSNARAEDDLRVQSELGHPVIWPDCRLSIYRR
jgi:hypothetical protein